MQTDLFTEYTQQTGLNSLTKHVESTLQFSSHSTAT